MANWIPKIEYTELNTGTPKTFTFDSPPEGDPFNEERKAAVKSTRSSAGVRQTQYNYSTIVYKLKFIFQSKTLYDSFVDFFDNHAVRGGDFKYFPSSDEIDFEVFEMSSTSAKFPRPIPDGAGDFEYDIAFNIERVL